MLDAFGVGFAPKPWDQILLRGQRAGYSVRLAAPAIFEEWVRGYGLDFAPVRFRISGTRSRVTSGGFRPTVTLVGTVPFVRPSSRYRGISACFARRSQSAMSSTLDKLSELLRRRGINRRSRVGDNSQPICGTM